MVTYVTCAQCCCPRDRGLGLECVRERSWSRVRSRPTNGGVGLGLVNHDPGLELGLGLKNLVLVLVLSLLDLVLPRSWHFGLDKF